MNINVAKAMARERFIKELKKSGMPEDEIKKYVETKHFEERIEILASQLIQQFGGEFNPPNYL